MPANSDLTTLFVAHLAVLRAASVPNAGDASGAVMRDVVTVRADVGSQDKDLNSDEYVYLQSHA